MWDSIRRGSLKSFVRKLRKGVRYLHLSEVRGCRCCQRLSLIVTFAEDGETQHCIRCGANLRYELLAEVLRGYAAQIPTWDVLELDPDSPLRPVLQRARRYVRTYWAENGVAGCIDLRNARCEDATRFTFEDETFDLIVSSEVLEHVPAVGAAASEIVRVLRPGGRHVFTVPVSAGRATVRRAIIENGSVVHLTEPEYHADPEAAGGILAFWSFGEDLPDYFSRDGFKVEKKLEMRAGGRAKSRKIAWEGTKSHRA